MYKQIFSTVVGTLAFIFVPMYLSTCALYPVKIGFIGPLTGPSSAVGLGARNGFLMAMGKGDGAAPGKIEKMELIVLDDGNNQDHCLESAKKLKELGCRILLLATTSQAAAKAVPWALDEGMLIISPTVSDPAFSGKDDYFFRVNESSGAYGEEMAGAISQRYGLRKVVFIGDINNKRYVTAVFDAFKANLEGAGGQVVSEYYFDSSKGLDEGPLLNAIKESGAEAIVIVTASSEAAAIAKYLEKANNVLPLFFPPWPLTLDLIKNGGQAVEGAVAVSIADMEFRTEKGKAFRNAFIKEYGEEPSFTAMFGWESAAVLRQILDKSRDSSPNALKKQILETSKFKGLQGDILFDKNGDAARNRFLFSIKNGHFVRLD